MNCKPGDMAIIVRPCAWQGWVVEVIRAVSMGDFDAPDGTWMRNAKSEPSWLIKAPRPFGKPPHVGTAYGVCIDAALRPIRDPGDDAVDEMLRPLPAEPVSA